MAKKKFHDKANLKKWLLSATGILLTSVSLLGDIQDIEFQFSNPKALSTVMEGAPSYFPEGQYLITYTNGEDLDEYDLDYSKMAMVISLEASLAKTKSLVGGLQPLLKHLTNFDYCCTINRTNPAYVIASIWVVEPVNLKEMEELKHVLHEYSVFYAFNDDSSFVTLNNARIGKGLEKSISYNNRINH